MLSSNNRKTYRIYALVEPISNRPRYVGQTADTIENRLREHVRKRRATAKGEWVQSLLDANLLPGIVLLEEFVGYRRQAYERETHWIRQLRSEGQQLLNVP